MGGFILNPWVLCINSRLIFGDLSMEERLPISSVSSRPMEDCLSARFIMPETILVPVYSSLLDLKMPSSDRS